MQSVDKNIQWYLSKFDAFEQSLNGEKSKPLHTLRREAIRRFTELGFPTNRQEEWRFTNIAPILKNEFQPILKYDKEGITQRDLQRYLIDGAVQLVFVNGIFSSELSTISMLPSDCLVGSLREISIKHPEKIKPYLARQVNGGENAFTALNTAFLWDGAFVSVPSGVMLNCPLQLLFVATDSKDTFTAQPRNIIVANTNSRFKIVETFVGLASNAYLTNVVTEVILGENSVVEYDKIQFENTNAFHVSTMYLQMNRASSFISNAFSLGGSIVRNNITATLNAEESECTLNGLSLGTDTQIIDNHTTIDHAQPNCQSHELYKAILDGASKGIFNGKIFVRKAAQKTDAKQTNRTLLLSDDASINAKPQLEIFADDVKCTHGATIGQLDADQIFYLRSRGIDLPSARALLTTAFAGDVINRVTVDPLRQLLEQAIQERLLKRHLSY